MKAGESQIILHGHYIHIISHSFCQLGELDLLASTFFKNHPISVERHPFSLNTIFSGQLNATLPAQKTQFEDTLENKKLNKCSQFDFASKQAGHLRTHVMHLCIISGKQSEDSENTFIRNDTV